MHVQRYVDVQVREREGGRQSEGGREGGREGGGEGERKTETRTSLSVNRLFRALIGSSDTEHHLTQSLKSNTHPHIFFSSPLPSPLPSSGGATQCDVSATDKGKTCPGKLEIAFVIDRSGSVQVRHHLPYLFG